MAGIELRGYQRSFIGRIRAEIERGQRRICGVAPCGSGKTIMMGWLIRDALERGESSIFFVHRQELIEQTSNTFWALGIPHDIIGKSESGAAVKIASVQTLARRLDSIDAPDLLICDECHHILAATYMKIIEEWDSATLIGVTATPERMGGVRLGDVFDVMVEGSTVEELINAGALTKYSYFAPTVVDTGGLRVEFGEYVKSDIEGLMTQNAIVGDIIGNYRRYTAGASAICYCVNVRHSERMAEAFNEAGITAAHCDGDTPKAERQRIVNDFRSGRVSVLCNAELFGEGFDVPNTQAVILARPTKSLTVYIQQSMRSMRPDPANPNKTAVIIDHVGNYMRHGLPDDSRNWSLADNVPKAEISTTKVCPHCGNVERLGVKICSVCGYEFPTRDYAPARVINRVRGEIGQVHSSDKGKAPIVRKYESFVAKAKAKDYKPAWAVYRTLEFVQNEDDLRRLQVACNYGLGWLRWKWGIAQRQSHK